MMRGLIVLGLLLLGACTYAQNGTGEEGLPPLSPLSQDRDAPGLALLAHLADRHFAAVQDQVPTTCASLAPEPLTAEEEARLIARFERLAPAERCVAAPAGGTVDAITGEPAVLIQAYGFACGTPDECSAWASVPGEPSARYTMRWQGSSWAFERDRRLLGD